MIDEKRLFEDLEKLITALNGRTSLGGRTSSSMSSHMSSRKTGDDKILTDSIGDNGILNSYVKATDDLRKEIRSLTLNARDKSGRFTGKNAFKTNIDEQIDAMRRSVKDVQDVLKKRKTADDEWVKYLEKKVKEIDDIKPTGNEEVDKEQERLKRYTKAELALANEVVNSKNIELKNQSFFKEKEAKNLKLENEIRERQIEFEKKYLDKKLAIQNKEDEARKKREEWELKGYNKSGRKNSGFELANTIGSIAEGLKSDSIGRNIGKGVSSAFGAVSKGLSSISTGKMDVSAMASGISGALSKFGPWGMAAGGLINIFKTLFELYSKVDGAASKYARTVGGGKLAMEKVKTAATGMAKELNNLGNISYDAADLIQRMTEYSTVLGRNLEYLSTIDIGSLKNLKDFGVDDATISQFDTFGVSVSRISEKLANLYNDSGRKGLNAKAVQETMLKNLKMAQNYNFSNGVKALTTMAERSVALKYNMESVAKFADKVSTLEGAAETGAQLSALGGDFARMGNPLELLYGGIVDAEQLQKRFEKMASSQAYFDISKGEMSIDPSTRQQMKAAAQSMGIDPSEFYNAAMASARRNRVDAQLGEASSILRGEEGEKTREYIRNIATLDKEGKAQITFHDEKGNEVGTKRLSELTYEDIDKIRKESIAKSNQETGSVGDILNSTRSIQDYLNDLVNTVKNVIAKGVVKLVDKITGYNLQDEIDKRVNEYENPSGKIESYEHRNVYHSISANSTSKSIATENNNFVTNNNTIQTSGKATGGWISGPGTSTSDSILTPLSNGEFVVNAKSARENMGLLTNINNGNIKPGTNTMNSLTVAPVRESGVGTIQQSNISQVQSIKVDPISFNGKIELTSNGKSVADIDINQLLNNQEFVNRLIKEIQIQTDYALDKTKLHKKW